MKIHPATETDLEEVSSWIQSETECRLWAGPSVSFPLRMDTLAKEIEFSKDNTFVAKQGDVLVAFGQAVKKPDGTTHLARVISSPRYRGTGAGFKLCQALLQKADSDRGTVTLNVYRSNTKALSLYQGLGFVENSELSNQDVVFMVRSREQE